MDPKHSRLSRYEGPSAIVEKSTNVYLYDSSTGELIAQFSDEAAETIRKGGILTLTSDGHGKITASV